MQGAILSQESQSWLSAHPAAGGLVPARQLVKSKVCLLQPAGSLARDIGMLRRDVGVHRLFRNVNAASSVQRK